jgi:hypothetical protein
MRARELTYRSKRTKEGVKLDLVMGRCLSQGGKCSEIRKRRARLRRPGTDERLYHK